MQIFTNTLSEEHAVYSNFVILLKNDNIVQIRNFIISLLFHHTIDTPACWQEREKKVFCISKTVRQPGAPNQLSPFSEVHNKIRFYNGGSTPSQLQHPCKVHCGALLDTFRHSNPICAAQAENTSLQENTLASSRDMTASYSPPLLEQAIGAHFVSSRENQQANVKPLTQGTQFTGHLESCSFLFLSC